MTNEMNYLTALCRAYLEGGAAVLDEDIDYKELYRLSNSHNLSAIVFSVINTAKNKEAVDSNSFKRFEDDFFEAVIRYDIQKKIAGELAQILEKNEIRYVFFKGAAIKELYPVPQARVMGDIDVLIDESNRAEVKRLLSKNGFEVLNSNGPVYDYSKENVKIEVHTKIISGTVGSSDAEACFEDAISRAEFDGLCGRLDDNYNFAYLITHIAHHFWFYGAGLKLILDLAVIQKSVSLDFDAVFEKLKEVGLDGFARVILSVCYKWFGTGESYVDNTESTEEFLLTFGAFGNVNRNKAAVIERKQLEEGKRNSFIMTRLRLAFPSYSKLKNIPYISFIEGRPYLTPLAWAYRFYYNFRYKKSFVKSATRSIGSDETNSEAENEFAYFKEIGLL